MILAVVRLFQRKTEPEAPALEECEDGELMLRYAAGDVAAFEVLLRRHEKKILNFVYRSVRDRARAEEITQDVFLKVVRTASRYEKTAKFTTWLYTIARNACIDESRRRAKHRTVSLDATIGDEPDGATFVDKLVDDHATSGTAAVSRAEFVARVRLGLAALPEEQREVFVMRHFEGLRFREIADVVGVTENTVKSRMRYALSLLRGYVADYKGFSFDELEADEIAQR